MTGGCSVAHVTTVGDALEFLLKNQLGAIARAGFDVAGVSAPGPVDASLRAIGVRHIAAPFVRATSLTPWSDLRLCAELVRMFRRERFAIVHTHTAKADLYAAMAARAAGVPFVVTTLHGFYFHDLMPPRTRRFYVALARLGMSCCDVVLSQNPEDVETALRERICTASKIELLGNGIDVVRFDRSRLDPAEIRRRRAELGIADGVPVIGFVGRLVAEKGVFELLAAAAIVRARFPTARLLVVGGVDRAKRDAIHPEAAARYGIADMCVFAGHRNDLPELYASMDVFALPSHREGFPRTPMEASAMGIPVVATNIRGCRSVVDDGRTGLLVPLNEPAGLAAAIIALLADSTRARSMASEGRRTALERFDERRVFAKVLETYQRLLDSSSRPSDSQRRTAVALRSRSW